MKLKLTYLREGNEAVDVAVTAEATTSLAELASALRAADPARPSGPSRQEPATLRLHMDDPSGPRHEVLNPSERLIESSLASGATISIAPASGFEQASRRGDVAATVTVIDGPDRGKTFELARGSSSLGRDSANRIVLSDALVSKTHARINVSDHLEIMDAGSANGTLVNDVAVDRAFLADGDRITVGDTVLSVRWTAATQAVFDEGVVFFNRPPRLDPQYEGRQLTAPEPPEKPRGQRLPYLALLAPLVMGGVILLIDPSNLFSLVFIALSPVLLLAGWIDGIVQSRREWKRAASQFNESVESIRSEIVRLHDEERAGRRRETPSVAEVVDAGRARNGVLWTRRPEHEAFLTLRLGEGRVPSRHELEMPSQRKGPAQLWAQLEELRDEIAFVADTPATENLREAGSIGVCGPSDTARAVARGIVAQLIGLHSPAELALVALSSTASSVSWDWLKWLPHVGSPLSPLSSPPLATGGPAATALIAALEELIATRSEAKTSAGEPTVLPTVVLLVEDDAPVERARLVGLAENGPDVGVHLIWVAPSLDRVPAACRTFVDVRATAGDSAAGFVRTGIGVQPVTVEPLGADDARRLARSLSPVVDAGARVDDASDVPSSVSLLHLIGPDLAQQSSAVLERWHETNSILTGPLASATPGKIRPNLRAVFGQAATEPFALDLRTDGPHALVGGTTGSGKSEFLQAWVLALAAAHSPQRVSFLFVDYKGGAAFADCVDLPHSVGLVTDLSPHLVRRALTSLRAELRYREHLFNRKKVKDIVEFERTGDPDVPPSLVIVVDEFAALATEVPEFVDGVVDVAQRGRSLGLHLVLATQRPAGVIRDNLRANTNLRVALRMADEADSTDVLGTPAAAQFDPSLPGRGAAKTGPGRIRVFQSGYAGGWTSDEPEPADIQIEELAYGGGRVWEAPADPDAEARAARVSSGPTDIKRIVSTVRSAAGEAQLPAPRKPWLPELATTYDFSKLPNPRTDAELLLGVVDDAASQSQPTVSYLPDRDGNMAIIGTGGAGKSTALRTIAVASAVTVRGGPVHVYGLDFGSGGLQMLQPLPHVGAVISGDDEERVARLLRWLRDLVDDRAVRFAEARAGSIVEDLGPCRRAADPSAARRDGRIPRHV